MILSVQKHTNPMKNVLLVILIGIFCTVSASAQHSHEMGRVIVFPDVPGYLTLKADLHMHTVFSDGAVWPNIRVQEANRDGLDAIAMTDHLEYQPHQVDIPHPDRNRSHEVASSAARNTPLMVISGSEITRSMPPGHNNAIFIQDANKLLVEDPIEVFREAKRQGGFTFWNHPNWTAQYPDGIAKLTDMHRQLIDEGLLSGIEVINMHSYSDEALTIALENNLTILGTSDVHGLIDWDYEVHQGGHRPVTLIFATERSQAAMKEALEAGRTVAYYKNMLVGREEHVTPLLYASMQVKEASYQANNGILYITIENTSDVSYILDNRTDYTFHEHADIVIIEAQKTTELQVKTIEQLENVQLTFEVLNAVIAPDTHPEITIDVAVSAEEEDNG